MLRNVDFERDDSQISQTRQYPRNIQEISKKYPRNIQEINAYGLKRVYFVNVCLLVGRPVCSNRISLQKYNISLY